MNEEVQAFPRRLTAGEYALLAHVLAPLPELRDQLDSAIVAQQWTRSLSFDLAVDDRTPRSSLPDGPAPIGPIVINEAGEYVGELLVWVADGRLAALEYAWVTDLPPSRLPDVAEIRLT